MIIPDLQDGFDLADENVIDVQTITDAMMTEISIVGGFLIAMSGLSIMKVKDFHTLNYLPALLVPIIWCLIRG